MNERQLKEQLYNVTVLGNCGVGKTTLSMVYVNNYCIQQPLPTVRFCMFRKQVVHKGRPVMVQIWDTAGQEQYRSIAPQFYRQSRFVIIAYIYGDQESLDGAVHWLMTAKQECPRLHFVLVATKCDLKKEETPDLKQVTENAEKVAQEFDIKHFKTAAREYQGVNEVFQHVLDIAIEDLAKKDLEVSQIIDDIAPKRKSCCGVTE